MYIIEYDIPNLKLMSIRIFKASGNNLLNSVVCVDNLVSLFCIKKMVKYGKMLQKVLEMK